MLANSVDPDQTALQSALFCICPQDRCLSCLKWVKRLGYETISLYAL